MSACGSFLYALTEEHKLLVHTMLDLLAPRPALGSLSVTPAASAHLPSSDSGAMLNASDSAHESKSKRSPGAASAFGLGSGSGSLDATESRSRRPATETSSPAPLSPLQRSSSGDAPKDRNSTQESDWTILQ